MLQFSRLRGSGQVEMGTRPCRRSDPSVRVQPQIQGKPAAQMVVGQRVARPKTFLTALLGPRQVLTGLGRDFYTFLH